MFLTSNDIDHPLAREFSRFVERAEFPCVGAKAALNRDGMDFVVARDLRSAWDDLRILPALISLARSYRENPELFQSLVVIFEDGSPDDEVEFERLLWDRLTSLAQKDEWLGQDPDQRVAHDPDDPHFAMSFGGEAFFVVGLHPKASRPARRFRYPAMAFNLHDQFTKLREQGRYAKLQSAIQLRDVALAGSPNPMLAPHGTASAARQYSGRSVDDSWQCPYSGRGARHAA